VEIAAALLDEAWAALGGPAARPALALTGQRPGLLPSSLAALPAMIAAVSASTLAAAVLDAARSGRPAAAVTVDARHVAVAARSERHARREGDEPRGLLGGLSSFFGTADGSVRLHANYPWHRARLLAVLGCDERPAAVAAAVRGWKGAELEDALAAAGAIGYAVRTVQEWAAHPQGRAVAGLPVAGRTPGRPTPRRAGEGRAAGGLRVLDLTRVIAGPVATRTLAAWGADVLRLDSPGLPELPAQAVDTLSGKRSAALDLATPGGRARLEELLARADVLVQGYRPGALARFGLAAPALAERHPHLAVVTLSAWGPAGPWSGRRGFDSVVQGPTGIAAAEGAGGAPGVLPAQVLDHATGYLGAAAALLALAARERGEPVPAVQLSLAQTARWLLGGGTQPREAPADPDPAPYLVTLSGAAVPTRVVAPPGSLADLRPEWHSTTDLGGDEPSFPGVTG
jgi:crotonobetainyl-CoA:carnitine CoA-transferase CaiB-like acyl-CoA transferase